jgi:hypothetical protein
VSTIIGLRRQRLPRGRCDVPQRLSCALLQSTLPCLWVLALLVWVQLTTNLEGKVGKSRGKRPERVGGSGGSGGGGGVGGGGGGGGGRDTAVPSVSIRMVTVRTRTVL